MTINIFNVGGKSSESDDDKEVKKSDILDRFPKEKIMKGIAKAGILTIIGGELNRVRPPKRNIGLVLNWFTAMAVTDVITNAIFKDKEDVKKDPDVVSEVDSKECECKCESFKETMEDDLK